MLRLCRKSPRQSAQPKNTKCCRRTKTPCSGAGRPKREAQAGSGFDAKGRTSTLRPWKNESNMDVKELQEGSTLYFPVFQKGGLIWTGDSHCLQGNGEVNLTALECSYAGGGHPQGRALHDSKVDLREKIMVHIWNCEKNRAASVRAGCPVKTCVPFESGSFSSPNSVAAPGDRAQWRPPCEKP